VPGSLPRCRTADPPRSGGRDRPRLVGLAVFAGYAALAFVVFRTAWQAPSTHLIGSCCDQPPTVDFLAWTGFAVTHGHNPFVVHYLNSPDGINLLWQPDGMPLLSLAATPFEWVLGPVVTYNLAVTLALPLSGIAAYAALRRWIGGYAGPILGGLFYGFSPFMTTQALGHLNVMFVPIPPLVLLATSDLLIYRRWRWWVSGTAIGVLLTAQFLIGQEILVGTLLVTAVVVVVILACHWEQVVGRWPSVVGGGLVAGGTALATAAWPLVVLLFGPYRLVGQFEPTPFSTDLANLVLPGYTGQFRPGGAAYFTQWDWSLGESSSYVGVVLIVLSIVVAARWWRRTPVKAAAIAGVVMTVLSLGPSVHLAGLDLHVWMPSALLLKVPFLRNMLPSRLMVFTDLAVAVLLAQFVRRAFARRPDVPARTRWLRWTGSVVVLLAALVPLAPSVDYLTTVYAQPAFFRTAAVDAIPDGGHVLVAPFPEGGPHDGGPMIWQAQSGFRFAMVGGYVFTPMPDGRPGARYGGDPTVLTTRLADLANGVPVAPLTPALVDTMRTDLSGYGLSAAVVGPMPGRAQAVATLTAVIGRPPVTVGGVQLWNGDLT